MLLTLHRYILRDLFKTFALCGTALTLLVTMGGGVANLFRSEGLSAIDIAKLFVLFIPIAATIVLPIAAMFSAAMTYGRLSADNEITACRAAGINVHRLLWSVVLLGCCVSLTTYYCWNYIIPRFVQAAEDAGRLDLARIATARLQKNHTLQYSKLCLHADHIEPLRPDPRREGRQTLELRGVAFFELEGSRIAGEGTATRALVYFDQGELQPEVSGMLEGVRSYNTLKSQYLECESQPIPPYTIPLPFKERLSFLDLPTLRAYARQPATMREIVDQLRVVRHGAVRMLAYDTMEQGLTSDARACTLTGAGAAVELTARKVSRSPKYGDLTLEGAVAIVSPEKGEPTTYRAATVTVTVNDHRTNRDRQVIDVDLADVEHASSQPGASSDRVLKKAHVRLPALDVPQAILERIDAIPDADLLNPALPVRLSEAMQKDRTKLIERVTQKASQVVSQINFRSSMALSGAALIVLAAMLGILFRGSQVLTAFGISCLPALVVLLVTMAGRNLADFPTMSRLGLSLMWAVDALLIVVTVAVGARFVRR